MRGKSLPLASLLAVAMAMSFVPARAETVSANCDVSKNGDKWHGVSGPCTVSQRHAYVEFHFKNGVTYRLSPTEKANHYKDDRGNKVERTKASSEGQTFKWEGGRKVVVTFIRESSHDGGAHSSSYTAGATAPDLADLVGARAGQAEGELTRRGYEYVSGSTSGNAKYTNWFSRSAGRCVTIRTQDGRYKSIVQAPPYDCKR